MRHIGLICFRTGFGRDELLLIPALIWTFRPLILDERELIPTVTTSHFSRSASGGTDLGFRLSSTAT
jgi:hypothetical protein